MREEEKFENSKEKFFYTSGKATARAINLITLLDTGTRRNVYASRRQTAMQMDFASCFEALKHPSVNCSVVVGDDFLNLKREAMQLWNRDDYSIVIVVIVVVVGEVN